MTPLNGTKYNFASNISISLILFIPHSCNFRYFKDIVKLLARVDSELLLLLKTNDCLRHLDKALGAPINTTKIVAAKTADVMLVHELNELWYGSAALQKDTKGEKDEATGEMDINYIQMYEKQRQKEKGAAGWGDKGGHGLEGAITTAGGINSGALENQRDKSGQGDQDEDQDKEHDQENTVAAATLSPWLSPRAAALLWRYSSMQVRLVGLQVVEWTLWWWQ